MPLKYALDKHILYVTDLGNSTVDEIKKTMGQVYSAEEFEAGPHLIWDARLGEGILDGAVIRSFLHAFSNMKRKPLSDRWAFIIDKPVQIGISRQFAIYAEEYGVIIESFDTVESAEAWLKTQ